jgi:hypothetical protein
VLANGGWDLIRRLKGKITYITYKYLEESLEHHTVLVRSQVIDTILETRNSIFVPQSNERSYRGSVGTVIKLPTDVQEVFFFDFRQGQTPSFFSKAAKLALGSQPGSYSLAARGEGSFPQTTIYYRFTSRAFFMECSGKFYKHA